MKVILKDEPDIDPNDQSSILEHLDKVVCGYSLSDDFCFAMSFWLLANFLWETYLGIFLPDSSSSVPFSGYSHCNLFLFSCDKICLLCFRVCFRTTEICWNFNFLKSLLCMDM